jgi:serine/threonine protein kinase
MNQLSPLRMGSGMRPLPRPAFGSSPNLQALVLEAEERLDNASAPATVFYEVTIASIDQPKLLSRLSESLGDLGLNICEAHAFNTKDRFALDVFVVNGWVGGGTEDLEEVLSGRLQELPPPAPTRASSPTNDGAVASGSVSLATGPLPVEQRVPAEELAALQRHSMGGADDWEMDPREIVFHEKIASGAFGDLFRGTYCGQDVAIKILRGVQDDSVQFQEFLQEVAIMRKVRHRNVVQFIGACTERPNLCIVFEYMRGGSVYDFVRKNGPLRVSAVLRIAVEVARGMDYLHKRKIVHRDLKAANLLMDEHGTVKIADFGVARVLDGAGVMTAETGTYRWMAPEVIEHKPYSEKADVFSFGVVMWELLTGLVPYSDMTPLQAAVGVVQKGLRPPIPANCPPPLADIMRLTWQRDPVVRPSFEALKVKLEELHEVYRQQEEDAGRRASQDGATPSKRGSLLFSRLRSGGSGKG